MHLQRESIMFETVIFTGVLSAPVGFFVLFFLIQEILYFLGHF